MDLTAAAYILGGFALLLMGGEAFVSGAVAIAKRSGLSPLLIGLTLVGFGTSTPELLTSIQAAMAGSPGIAIGNVVGSNIANILLILGVAAVVQPIAIEGQSFRRDGTALSLASLICLALVLWGHIDRLAGTVLVSLLAIYVYLSYRHERLDEPRQSPQPNGDDAPSSAARSSLAKSVAMSVAGLALTLLGARLLVEGAVSSARGLGVDETLIGLTIVAVGTSLPELVTSLVASWRNQGALAFGNVIGSNLFNILGILGVTAILQPLEVPAIIAGFDIWVMLAATAAAILFAVSHRRLSRFEGTALLAGYLVYVGILIAGA